MRFSTQERDNLEVCSYFVKSWAVSGVMLGGVKKYRSSRFETEDQAERFLYQQIEANEEANRDVDGIVEVSDKPPHILANGMLAE